MIQTDRITIVVEDGAVYTDEHVIIYLDLSSCGIPEDVHAFIWFKDKGQIEFKGVEKCNEHVTVVPEWAWNALSVYEQEFNKTNTQP